MVLVAGVLAISFCLLAQAARPNIVFIIADDLGWSDVGFHSGDVNTPNLDALAMNGIIFKRHYSQPLCTPSRAALLTGDYPIRHGMQGDPCLPGVADGLPLDAKLMPEYFRELGYRTHLVGKWHLGYETQEHLPTRRGFDTFFGYLNGYLGYWDGTHYYDGRAGRDIRRGEEGAWHEVYGRYLTEVLTEEAIDVIGKHDVNSSLLLFLNHNAVHTTLLSLEKEAPSHVANNTNRGIFREMAHWMDWSVGELVSVLDKKDMLSNTIIVFISDNGAPSINTVFENYGSNWPFRGQKSSVHEGGIRTAALIYSKLIDLKPRITEQIFHITDWFPTLYSAVGGNQEDLNYKDGIDQWSSILSGTAGPRQEILVNIDEVQKTEAYINGRWKLIKNYDPHGGNAVEDVYTGVSPDWMPYNAVALNNSPVAKILGLPDDWAQIREAATVRGQCSVGAEEVIAHECHTRHCLFDLEVDPAECKDVAEQNPTIVSQLHSKLDYYRTVLVPQTPKIYSSKADPSQHHDYWSPWMNSSEEFEKIHEEKKNSERQSTLENHKYILHERCLLDNNCTLFDLSHDSKLCWLF